MLFDGIFDEARKILFCDMEPKYDFFKALASQTFMLLLLDERDPIYADQLIGSTIHVLNNNLISLNEFLNHSRALNDETEELLSNTEKLFYKIFLAKLQIPAEDFDRIFTESGTKKNIRMKNMMKEAFEFFFSSYQASFNEVFSKYREILIAFNFKDTLYMKMHFLGKIVFSSSMMMNQLLNELEINQNLPGNDFQNNEEEDRDMSFKKMIGMCHSYLAQEFRNVQPLDSILMHLKELNPQIANLSNILNNIAFELFSTPQNFILHHRINSVVSSYENTYNSDLSSHPLCTKHLNIQIIKKPKNVLYEDGFVYQICPYGYSKSSRFSYDRIVLFGKFNEDCFKVTYFSVNTLKISSFS